MEEEFPAPVAPPAVDVSADSDEVEAQVTTVAKISSRPRLPVIFNRLVAKPRLRALGQVITGQLCEYVSFDRSMWLFGSCSFG